MIELDLFAEDAVDDAIRVINNTLSGMKVAEKIEALNRIRTALHAISPFKAEPVDCVLWVKNSLVESNNYNPNTVAPKEMELLETSIKSDGYTQPVVGWGVNGHIEVVDGFHRNRVGKESDTVRERVLGYLPVVKINTDRQDKGDRIAATIRHNRARGKHKVEAMSDIVVELKRRNWSDDKIARELGMDADEVLRLCQITGIAELFADQEFSQSWDLASPPSEVVPDLEDSEPMEEKDSKRVFHTYDKWECHKAGFYDQRPPDGMTKEQCETAYCEFLRDTPKFEGALERVIAEWEKSCEHYLTNESMNRIAWLGQASLCIALKIPSCFRGGYNLLSESEKETADKTAFRFLNKWLAKRGEPELSWEAAQSKTEANLY